MKHLCCLLPPVNDDFCIRTFWPCPPRHSLEPNPMKGCQHLQRAACSHRWRDEPCSSVFALLHVCARDREKPKTWTTWWGHPRSHKFQKPVQSNVPVRLFSCDSVKIGSLFLGLKYSKHTHTQYINTRAGLTSQVPVFFLLFVFLF